VLELKTFVVRLLDLGNSAVFSLKVESALNDLLSYLPDVLLLLWLKSANQVRLFCQHLVWVDHCAFVDKLKFLAVDSLAGFKVNLVPLHVVLQIVHHNVVVDDWQHLAVSVSKVGLIFVLLRGRKP
jgi:hypothetical protein